jgi:hypothetical protein
MKDKIARAFAIAIVMTPGAAYAGPKTVLQPIQLSKETVRYQQGVATLDLEGVDGAVQITPLGMDHGSYVFGIAVYNLGQRPTNVDIADFSMSLDGQTVTPLTREDLEKKAANRAMWAQLAVAMAGGLSAYAAANQRDHYQTTLVTPRGTYRAYSSAPSVAGQIQATAIAAGTGVTLARIQNRLDETRAALGEQIVQLTTVDPGESYAGKIILNKIKNKSKTLPQPLNLTVRWNGQDYRFAFQIAKTGTRAPEFKESAYVATEAGYQTGADPAAPVSPNFGDASPAPTPAIVTPTPPAAVATAKL